MIYKGLLFDFDGTLLDTNDLIIETFQQVLEPRFPGKYSKKDLEAFIGPSLMDSFTQVDAKNVDVLIEEYTTWNRQHHDELVKEFDDVVEVLTILHQAGIRLAIVSTKRHDALIRGLNILGIAELFEVIIGNEDVQNTKPNPEPILLALERMHLQKHEVIMIGDNSHDIEGGQNAGVHTAGVAWSVKGAKYLKSLHPTYMLYSMKDLFEVTGVEMDAKNTTI